MRVFGQKESERITGAKGLLNVELFRVDGIALFPMRMLQRRFFHFSIEMFAKTVAQQTTGECCHESEN